MENVIDMLNGIIGEEKPPSPPSISESSLKKTAKVSKGTSSDNEGNDKRNDEDDDDEDDDDSSPERLKSKLIESMKNKREQNARKEREKDKEYHERPIIKVREEFKEKISEEPVKKANYIFYDPEMHWCETCNVFPKTAKDYLNHLHTPEHKNQIETVDTPWHDSITIDEFPTYSNALTKRVPIRGLQFFVPAASWYCKLCNIWMGDLHCASAHLKSRSHSDECNKFFQQNPHFEVDWMAARQRVYDNIRVPPPPQITSVSTTGMNLLESIPLQINTQKSAENEKTLSKKRKKKNDEKREKKKKRKTKKRKKAAESSSSSSSSSASSSSSSSESETESKGNNVKTQKIMEDIQANAHSIRVAMRNLSSKSSNDSNERGKWTTVQESQDPVPPPPPRIATPPIDPDAKKKDELMMSQWNAPVQPIISESEKKLLEELKGKLKSRPITDEQKKKDLGKDSKKRDDKASNRDRSKRSRSRDRRSRSRDRRRDSSKNRRSRSPKDGRSRGRLSPRRKRKSRSPRRRSRSQNSRYSSRRRSHSRSASPADTQMRSNSKSLDYRVEKPIVRYPEFRPRIPPDNKSLKKLKSEDETERKKSPSSKKKDHSSTSVDKKKLPFIGRMPVFKKQVQGSEGDKKDNENENSENYANLSQSHLLQSEQKQGIHDQQSSQIIQQHDQIHMHYEHYYDYEDLMPDPMQYVTLMGAPPPPPSEPPPDEGEDDKDILPPGVDETETDLIPKPISDAPIPKKGPLPKDFEEALNIIFPGEKKVNENGESKEQKDLTLQDITNHTFSNEATTDHPVEISSAVVNDETSQMSTSYSLCNQELSQDPSGMDVAYIQPPSMVLPDIYGQDMELKFEPMDKSKVPSPSNSEKLRRQEELDDLAMLGIDADDLAAQCM